MTDAEINELSERELELLKLVATGASNKEIAQTLFISSNTVKVHLRNIFLKIGVTSRTEAAMFAVRKGLVETASAQLGGNGEVTQATPGLQRESLRPNGLPSAANKKILTFRNITFLGLPVILLVILAMLFLRGKIFPINPSVAATSTPRVQWLQLANLPVPRAGLAVTNFENQIFTIGGEDTAGVSGMVEKFDPQTSIWTDLQSKPTPVSEINAASIGGLIYVPGGNLSSGKPTDVNEYYDPHSNQWTEASRLPRPLSGYALAVYEGRMYLFGGWDGVQVVSNSYVYDPRTNAWAEIPPMPTARAYAGAVLVGGRIFVIGGWDGQQALDVNEVYQPGVAEVSSRWSENTPLPAGRYRMGITNLADIIFIIGGTGPEQNLTVIALSPEDPSWGQLEAPIQSGWSDLGTVTIGTRLYALGGKNNGVFASQMWSYQAIFTITLPIVR